MSELPPPPLADLHRQKCVCFCGVSLLSPRSVSTGSSAETQEESMKRQLQQFSCWIQGEIQYVNEELEVLEKTKRPDDDAETLLLDELYKGLQIRLLNLQTKFQKVSELLMIW
jgi:hypothetical protein